LLLMFLLIWQPNAAQMIYDTLDLSVVEITERKLQRTAGYKVMRVDSVLLTERSGVTLAELMTALTPVFIRSYGQGGLATASVRGAAASHTQVIWNGLNINSPMPGQADFSLAPVYFVDEIEVIPGAGSLFQTSGGLGGSINLKTESFNKKPFTIELLQELGSFNTHRSFARINLGNEKVQSSTRIFFIDSKNDYKYPNNVVSRENPPVERRLNAAYGQKGLLQEIHWRAAKNTNVAVRLWLQDNMREIPPNIMVIVSDKNEQISGQFARSAIAVERVLTNAKISLQSGYIVNFSNYQNRISGTDTDNHIRSSLNIFSYENSVLKNLTLNGVLRYDRHLVDSDNYPETKTRNESVANLGANYAFSKNIHFNLLLRQEMIDSDWAPFLPSLGASLKPMTSWPLTFKANVAANFKAPSLNDLYWMPGGNPDLKNEKGRSYEAGFIIDPTISKIGFNLDATFFYSDIKNWILWQPDSVFSYWRPFNLRNVVSQGIEIEMDVSGAVGEMLWSYAFRYAFVSAINRKPISPADQSTGKQLMYVPEHAMNHAVRLTFRRITISYMLNYTGRRYTASDNSRYLPGFVVQDVTLSKGFRIKKSGFTAQLAIHNLTNTHYQVIAWQPMPGRSFNFSVRYHFAK
jgi:outer membrane cobalamin receptor